MSEGLEATIRDALTAEQRCGQTLHRPGMGGDPAWCRLPRGHDGPCAFFDPAAVAALAARAAEAYWVGDEQVTRAAQAMWEMHPASGPWDEAPRSEQFRYIERARFALGALIQGDTP